jgi:hypothetical protein
MGHRRLQPEDLIRPGHRSRATGSVVGGSAGAVTGSRDRGDRATGLSPTVGPPGQIRTAFAAGAYYPALLGAAGLGERILNDLIRDLRGDYAGHPATAPVRVKESFDNWPTAIGVLKDWGVLTEESARDYRRLGRLRNDAVHYRPALEATARDAALEAVLVLQRLVEALFKPIGGPPLYIDGIVGASFLARASEDLPLVRRYYLPNAVLVSPRYELRPGPAPGQFSCFDDADFAGPEGRPELTDHEFAAALHAAADL